MAHRDGVMAVDRALDLLEVFERAGPRLTLAQLARETGLVKSTALRLAASLVRRGYLARGEGGVYRLGTSLVRLGATYQAAFGLGDVVTPVLERLAHETGESAAFYVREGAFRVCLHRVAARRHHLLHLVQVGTQFPYDTGASGRVIRAFSEPDAPDPQAVRERLVAVSTSARTISDTGAVAAAVLGLNDAFVGAVSLAGASSRFGPAAVPQLTQAVLATAADIAAALGGSTARYRQALAALAAGMPTEAARPESHPSSPVTHANDEGAAG